MRLTRSLLVLALCGASYAPGLEALPPPPPPPWASGDYVALVANPDRVDHTMPGPWYWQSVVSIEERRVTLRQVAVSCAYEYMYTSAINGGRRVYSGSLAMPLSGREARVRMALKECYFCLGVEDAIPGTLDVTISSPARGHMVVNGVRHTQRAPSEGLPCPAGDA